MTTHVGNDQEGEDLKRNFAQMLPLSYPFSRQVWTKTQWVKELTKIVQKYNFHCKKMCLNSKRSFSLNKCNLCCNIFPKK